MRFYRVINESLRMGLIDRDNKTQYPNGKYGVSHWAYSLSHLGYWVKHLVSSSYFYDEEWLIVAETEISADETVLFSENSFFNFKKGSPMRVGDIDTNSHRYGSNYGSYDMVIYGSLPEIQISSPVRLERFYKVPASLVESRYYFELSLPTGYYDPETGEEMTRPPSQERWEINDSIAQESMEELMNPISWEEAYEIVRRQSKIWFNGLREDLELKVFGQNGKETAEEISYTTLQLLKNKVIPKVRYIDNKDLIGIYSQGKRVLEYPSIYDWGDFDKILTPGWYVDQEEYDEIDFVEKLTEYFSNLKKKGGNMNEKIFLPEEEVKVTEFEPTPEPPVREVEPTPEPIYPWEE